MQNDNVSMVQQPAPIYKSERIIILDCLRGIAILGILLMNIGSFSLPGGPGLLNETGLNFNTWYYVSLIPDGTQRALFSMLFGGGIILFIRSQEKKVGGLAPADYFFRRQLWLIIFSLFDVFILLWHGDILLDYACLGMIMFTFRNLSPKKLIIAGLVCMMLMMARENRNLYIDKNIIERGEAIALLDSNVVKLTPLQKDDLAAAKDLKENASHEKRLERAEKRIRQMRGSYREVYTSRSNRYLELLIPYLFLSLWDVLQFMFLGMAFFKMGILTGEAKSKVYWWMLVIGLSVGVFLAYLRLGAVVKYNFNGYDYAKNVIVEFYNLDRTFRALGFLGLVMLLFKSGFFKWIFAIVRPVGQMAFTCYLMQSLICGIIFYGIGFAYYAQLERYQVYLVVCAIWLFQIIFCHIWLRFFLFGPFEWLWRSLTYWKRQPFKQKEKASIS